MRIQSTRLVRPGPDVLPPLPKETLEDPEIVATIDGEVLAAAGQAAPVDPGQMQTLSSAALGVSSATIGRAGDVSVTGLRDASKLAGLSLVLGEHTLKTYLPGTYDDVAPHIDILQVSISGAGFANALDRDGMTIGTALSGVQLGADVLAALGHAVPALSPYMDHARTVSLVLKVVGEVRRFDIRLS